LWPTQRDRRALLLEQVERGAGLEGVHGHDRRAMVLNCEEPGDEAADPEKRHRREHHVVARDLVAVGDVHRVPHDRALRVDRTLRIGGTARAVHDHHAVGGRDARLHLGEEVVGDAGGDAARHQIGLGAVRPRALPVVPDRDRAQERRIGEEQRPVGTLLGQSRERGLEQREVVGAEEVGPGHEVGDVGVAEDPSQLTRLEERVDRHRHRADARRGVERDRPVDAVGDEDPDVGALADAVSEQPLGDGAGPGLRLGVCAASAAGNEQGAVPVAPGTDAQEHGHGGFEVGERHRTKTPDDGVVLRSPALR
jgi:hypothetical protein